MTWSFTAEQCVRACGTVLKSTSTAQDPVLWPAFLSSAFLTDLGIRDLYVPTFMVWLAALVLFFLAGFALPLVVQRAAEKILHLPDGAVRVATGETERDDKENKVDGELQSDDPGPADFEPDKKLAKDSHDFNKNFQRENGKPKVTVQTHTDNSDPVNELDNLKRANAELASCLKDRIRGLEVKLSHAKLLVQLGRKIDGGKVLGGERGRL